MAQPPSSTTPFFKNRLLFSVAVSLPLTFLLSCVAKPEAGPTPSQSATELRQKRVERRLEEVFEKLEGLQQAFQQTKTQLERVENSNLQQTTPPLEEVEEDEEEIEENTFVELGLLQAQIQDLEAFLKEVVKVSPHLYSIRNSVLSVLKLRDQRFQLIREEEIAKQGVAIAKEYNWRFGKEIMLWLFGFKWLWGWFTGFVPTTSTSEAWQDYQSVVEKNSKTLQTLEAQTREAEAQVARGLQEIETVFEQLINNSPLPEFKLTLLDIKLSLLFTVRNFLHSNLVLEEKLALFRQEMIASQPHTPFAVSSAQDEQLSLLEQFFKQEYLWAKEEQESVTKSFEAFFLPPLASNSSKNTQKTEEIPSFHFFVTQLLNLLEELRQKKKTLVDRVEAFKQSQAKNFSLSLSLSLLTIKTLGRSLELRPRS